jgi:hypothetical protein
MARGRARAECSRRPRADQLAIDPLLRIAGKVAAAPPPAHHEPRPELLPRDGDVSGGEGAPIGMCRSRAARVVGGRRLREGASVVSGALTEGHRLRRPDAGGTTRVRAARTGRDGQPRNGRPGRRTRGASRPLAPGLAASRGVEPGTRDGRRRTGRGSGRARRRCIALEGRRVPFHRGRMPARPATSRNAWLQEVTGTVGLGEGATLLRKHLPSTLARDEMRRTRWISPARLRGPP